MKIFNIIFCTLAVPSGLLSAAADNASEPQYTYETFLDQIGMSTEALQQAKIHGPGLYTLLYETYANAERVLTQDESHDFQTDLYAFMLARTVTANMLKNHMLPTQARSLRFTSPFDNRIDIGLAYYKQDEGKLLGEAHINLKEHPQIADWLVEFRTAQRKNALLCDRARLYAAMRELFIAVDDTWRAEQVAQFHQGEANHEPFTRACIRAGRLNEDDMVGCQSFKAFIIDVEHKRREMQREATELEDIRAAFKAFSTTN